MCQKAAKFDHCQKGLGNTSDKDKETENGNTGNKDIGGQILDEYRFSVKVAAIEVSDE